MIAIPKHMYMILACGKDKSVQPGQACRADEMYLGSLHKKGQDLAKTHGIPFLILSAKYGLMRHDKQIEWYDERFSSKNRFRRWSTFPEPYHGFFIGGEDYFGHAPRRLERLIAKQGIGKMLGELTMLQKNPDEMQRRIAAHVEKYPQ